MIIITLKKSMIIITSKVFKNIDDIIIDDNNYIENI